jgi:isopentenyl-diphosphate delta-isomerase
VEEAIARAVEVSPVPVLVKEVGAGINGEVSARLIKAGVHAIDVGGAGGTSWAGVEILRRTDSESVEEYWDVGTQTAICLLDAAMLRSAFHTTDIHGQQPPATFPLIIASGGLNSGSQMARALALGADLCASARPILKTFESGGSAAVCALVERWTLDLRRWMFLTGSSTIEQLRTVLEGNE